MTHNAVEAMGVDGVFRAVRSPAAQHVHRRDSLRAPRRDIARDHSDEREMRDDAGESVELISHSSR
jgi:hypothetical protein